MNSVLDEPKHTVNAPILNLKAKEPILLEGKFRTLARITEQPEVESDHISISKSSIDNSVDILDVQLPTKKTDKFQMLVPAAREFD